MTWDKRRSFNPRKRDLPPSRGPRRVSPSNAVVHAIMQCAAIHGQPAYRMQSRMFEVPGEEGKLRPFFVGSWFDRFGQEHYGGMPDVLVTPTVLIEIPGVDGQPRIQIFTQLALWVEAKSGTGKLSEKQELFRQNVLATGGEWLLCRDSAEELLRWFSAHKLVRP